MQLRSGRALRGTYVERGGAAGDRSVRFVAEPSGRFALWCQDSGAEARSDGASVWAIDDGVATFIGPVPTAAGAVFGLVPPTISEMLHPESAYIEAAFADPGTRDEELDMGQVRITGSRSSIVYDRSIDIIHEYRRPDGLDRRVTDLEVVEPTAGAFRWDGPVADPLDGVVVVTTVAPVDALEDVWAAPVFAAHVEHRTDVLSYWLDGPGAGSGGADLHECVAWAEGHHVEIAITVDLADGDTVAVPLDTIRR